MAGKARKGKPHTGKPRTRKSRRAMSGRPAQVTGALITVAPWPTIVPPEPIVGNEDNWVSWVVYNGTGSVIVVGVTNFLFDRKTSAKPIKFFQNKSTVEVSNGEFGVIAGRIKSKTEGSYKYTITASMNGASAPPLDPDLEVQPPPPPLIPPHKRPRKRPN
jgi:hypothetical protein